FFFFSSRRRHTRCLSDWSSDVCSSDLRIAHSPVVCRPSHSTITRLSPVPCSRIWRCLSPSLFHGLSRSILKAFASALTMFVVQRSEERRVGKEGRSRGWEDQ